MAHNECLPAQPRRSDACYGHACAVALDQVIKYLVETRLPFHELIPVCRCWAVPDLERGHRLFTAEDLPDTGLLSLTVLVIVLCRLLWRRTPPDRRIAHLGFA
jgi:signal peptidase II